MAITKSDVPTAVLKGNPVRNKRRNDQKSSTGAYKPVKNPIKIPSTMASGILGSCLFSFFFLRVEIIEMEARIISIAKSSQYQKSLCKKQGI